MAKGVRVRGNIQVENHRNVQVLPRWKDGKVIRPVVTGTIQLEQGGGGKLIRARVGGGNVVQGNKEDQCRGL